MDAEGYAALLRRVVWVIFATGLAVGVVLGGCIKAIIDN